MLLPKQVVTYDRLLLDGINTSKIKQMTINLNLFPTPFKKIYYVPTPQERKASSIDKPLLVLKRAISAYLGTDDFYYSCRTAQEFLGIKWQPSGEIHVVNFKLSRCIDLSQRIDRKNKKSDYRSKRISKILYLYGTKIIFHKGSVTDAKFRETPYGCFATKSQIKKDLKRFREI